jgi:hypothetical protein
MVLRESMRFDMISGEVPADLLGGFLLRPAEMGIGLTERRFGSGADSAGECRDACGVKGIGGMGIGGTGGLVALLVELDSRAASNQARRGGITGRSSADSICVLSIMSLCCGPSSAQHAVGAERVQETSAGFPVRLAHSESHAGAMYRYLAGWWAGCRGHK